LNPALPEAKTLLRLCASIQTDRSPETSVS